MNELSEINNANKLAAVSFPGNSILASREFMTWTAVAFVILATIGWLAVNGSVWWSAANASVWSSEVWSRSNSQHPLDPYTLTHMLHGVVCFWAINLLSKRLPLSRQFFLTILLACGWELLENSPFVIERYRVVTAASDYVGDALINSITDIAACCVGFYLTSKFRIAASVAFFVLVEIAMLFWVRDNLLLNVVMLFYPIDTIRQWQIGI